MLTSTQGRLSNKKKQVKYFFQTTTACEMCSKPLVEIIKVMHLSTNWKTGISNSVQNFVPGKKRSIWSFPEKSGGHYGEGAAKFGGIVQISRKAWNRQNESLVDLVTTTSQPPDPESKQQRLRAPFFSDRVTGGTWSKKWFPSYFAQRYPMMS